MTYPLLEMQFLGTNSQSNIRKQTQESYRAHHKFATNTFGGCVMWKVSRNVNRTLIQLVQSLGAVSMYNYLMPT